MTHEEFQKKWDAVADPVLTILKDYIAFEAYKGEAALESHRREMLEHTQDILESVELYTRWTPAKMATLIQYEDADEALAWLYKRVSFVAGFTSTGEDISEIDVSQGVPMVRINAPSWFKRQDFMTWLCSRKTATWHEKLTTENGGLAPNMQPSNLSDAFFTWTGVYDGSDSPLGVEPSIPDDIWEFVCEKMWELHGHHGEALIWVSNLE